MEDDLFPATGTFVGRNTEHGVITIRLPFLEGDSEALQKANPGRRYLLTVDLARILVAQITSQLDLLEREPK